MRIFTFEPALPWCKMGSLIPQIGKMRRDNELLRMQGRGAGTVKGGPPPLMLPLEIHGHASTAGRPDSLSLTGFTRLD
jgi:hypothetical protein